MDPAIVFLVTAGVKAVIYSLATMALLAFIRLTYQPSPEATNDLPLSSYDVPQNTNRVVRLKIDSKKTQIRQISAQAHEAMRQEVENYSAQARALTQKGSNSHVHTK